MPFAVMPRRTGLCLIATFSVLMAAAVRPAAAAEPALIIVDGSGSMWGKMEGDAEAKFYATRDALRDLLTKAAPQSRVGLASFGHRRKGDCGDVEVLAPVEAGGSVAATAALEGLNPKGKGPLALSLREAAKTLGPGAAGTVIAVHDNIDNCQQDVCAAAADIAKTNPALKIITIGLGLEKPDRERIQCVAKATGGRHFDAATAPAIVAALGEAFALAGLDAAAPPPAAAPAPNAAAPAPQGPPGLRLTAALSENGAVVDAPLAWRIAKAGAGLSDPPLVERTSREINEALPPGRYTVSTSLGLVSRTFELEVTPAGPTVSKLNLDAGRIAVSATASKLGDKLTAPVTVVASAANTGAPAGTPLWIGREAATEHVVPSGQYAVEITDGLAKSIARLDVAPGATVRSDLILETGRLELNATGVEGGSALDDAVFQIAVDDADAPNGRREIARSAAHNPAFTLQAGTYYVTGRVGSSEVRERVAISSGDIVKKTLILGIARLSVRPLLSGISTPPENLPIVTRITQAGGDKSLVGHSTAAAPVFVLGAGKYRVESQVGTLNIRAAQTIDVQPGKDVSVTLKLDAAEISVAGPAAAQPSTGVRAALRDQKGRVVWRSRQGDQMKTIAAPGNYVLQIETSSGRTETPVTLKAGEARSVEAAPP